MGLAKQRICDTCGAVEITASRATSCSSCFNEARRKAKRQEEKEYLESLGYADVEYIGFNAHLKPEWKFVHSCGVQQTWTYSNILKRMREDPDSIPCSHCGGQRRSKNGTAQSAENRKIKNPVGWIDYRSVVRRLTENVYAKHKDEINPLGLKRGKGPNDYHLDHIVSIAQCWEMGLEPEVVACKENLQMLTSFDNISKGRK